MSAYSAHRPSRNRFDAVHLFCMECQGASVDVGYECRSWREVRECPCAQSCSLWPYRLGGTRRPLPAAANIVTDMGPKTRRKAPSSIDTGSMP